MFIGKSPPEVTKMDCILEDLNRESAKTDEFTILLQELSNNPNVLCKSQQRDEMDISPDEKVKILKETFNRSKPNFLSRFGRFLTSTQIDLFQQFEEDIKDGYEIKFHLKNLTECQSKTKKRLRNKRYAALKGLIEKGAYFSEKEMMKRNPLLYEQLVGQYLSVKEKRVRDRPVETDLNFVGLLMTGIEHEQMEAKRKIQELEEHTDMQENTDSDCDEETCDRPSASETFSSDEKPIRSLWGEFREENSKPVKARPTTKDVDLFITSKERQLLKEEFVTTMYEHFLEGKDEDFDYNTVDNSDEYDNLEIIANDEEEKYFDSEEPEGISMTVENNGNVEVKEESSEDELDIYMNALNQHPSVCQLSEDIKKL